MPTFHRLATCVALTALAPVTKGGELRVIALNANGAQADLRIVSSLTMTPASIAPGGKVTLSSWVVRNSGTVPSGAFSNGFYLSTDSLITSSDVYLTGNSNLSLDPGAQHSWGGPQLTIPATTTLGTYFIGILVDRTNTVDESVENNNYASVKLRVATPGPDLIVTGIDLLVMNPGDGAFATGRTIYTHSQVRLRPVIKNVGDASTNVSRVSWQVVKGPLVYEGQLPPSSGGGVLGGSLAPGATTTGLLEYFGPGQVIAGTYELTITVDATNSLNESNEANNGLTTSLPILTSNRYTGQPDLRTTASATEDTSNQCSSARRYDVTSVTTNAGTFPAYVHGNFVVQASTGLTTLHNEGYWILINPGASKTIVYSASLAFGTSKQFTFLADPKELVREGTDANNLYTLTIDAPPKSASGTGDLVVSEAFFEHTPTNGLYWLQVTLKNQGPGSVTICEYSWSTQNAPAGLSWSANAPQFPTTLAAGQTWKTPTSARQSLPSGTFSVTIQVNPSGAVPETNTGNNLHTFTVRIPEDVRIRR